MYVLSRWDDGMNKPMSDSDQTVARLLQVWACVWFGFVVEGGVRTPTVVCLCDGWFDQPIPSTHTTQIQTHKQASLEDLLVAHRVDLMMVGHHHSYQRTCQVRALRLACRVNGLFTFWG